jgi:hypothetical protein
MGDDSINMVILHIDMGYVVTLSVVPALVAASTTSAAIIQGPTPVHFSAQRKRCMMDRGCIQGLFRGYFEGCQGVSWNIGQSDKIRSGYYCPVDRQDDGMTGHPYDFKTIFRILRSSSYRQDDRIHSHPGDRSSISCQSGIRGCVG